MSETKKRKASLILNLIIMIGLGIAALTGFQVAVLSQLAKKDSRIDNINNYVMLTTSIRESLEHTIDGYFRQLNPYVNSDVMKPGIFDLAGNWLQQNPQIRAKEYDYIMLADAQGLSYNDNGTRTNIKDRDYLKAIIVDGKEQYLDNLEIILD